MQILFVARGRGLQIELELGDERTQDSMIGTAGGPTSCDLIRARLFNTFAPRSPEIAPAPTRRVEELTAMAGKEVLINPRSFEASRRRPRRRLSAEEIHRSRVQVPSALR